jgi:hypothetical protein
MAGRIEYDESGRMVIVHESTLSAELAVRDACVANHNAGNFGSKEMRYYGEVTPLMLQTYCDKTGVSWDEAFQNPVHFRRILNNPENSAMRVWKGRL